MIPTQMNAVAIEGEKGRAEALHLTQIDTPSPKPGEILIKVAAAGVNRLDVFQRRGNYPPPPGAPDTLGVECSGVVAAVGEGAPRWKVGDEVCALLGGGGYADYVAIDARHALPIPKGVSLTEAGALPETIFTVFSNVFEIAGLTEGETLLIHGANSGIGLTAVALAKAAGAKVIATARSAAKLEEARGLGADVLIDTSAEDFVEAVKAAGGADVVLDMIAGDYVQKSIECMNPGARMVFVASLGAMKSEVNLGMVLRKRLTLTGSVLRPRPADEKARLAAAVEAIVWPWIASGAVRPVIGATFPLAQAAAAHLWIEGDHAGKAVLTV